jgi:carbamoyltransferase
MNILGLNYFFHDSSACVLIDGKLAVAIEEERFTRKKHTQSFPQKAIERCLSVVGLNPRDIDAVAVSIKPSKNWANKVLYGLAHAPNARPFVWHELIEAIYTQSGFRRWYRNTWPQNGPKVYFVPHHIAHAAGTFLVSPFESAAIVSLDGSGEWSTSFIGQGNGNQVTCFSESFFPHSLGYFYEAATQFCGFRVNYDEGKTMGLAPFGDPEVYSKIVDRMATVGENGTIRIDLSYFKYQFDGYERCSPKFFAAFGSPRKGEELQKNHRDIAAAFQRVLEERALNLSSFVRQKTKSCHLIIAGGVALNSVMNGRILQEAGFDDIYVMPAAGDNGTSIGAAFYVYNTVLRQPRVFVHDNPFLGTSYSDEYIGKLMKECKLSAKRYNDIVSIAARMLADGKILGWFQGRMEIGPRALGNRSILANPTLPYMKDKINAEVKHREAFRPFAPSTPVEMKDQYFDIIGESPFMLKVCPVKAEKRDLLPAITHVDGSARLHTVRKDINPIFHDLLERFGNLTGIPVLLNTSFNVQGEPIIESPEDAIRCLYSTGLDALAIGGFLITKFPSTETEGQYR